MRFKQFLSEMPMRSYHVSDRVGQPEYGWAFSPTDQRLLRSEKVKTCLHRILAKFDINFNFVVMPTQTKAFEDPDDPNQTSVQDGWGLIKANLKAAGIDTNNAITYIKTSGSGDPMTCWMLCHTFGHALFANEAASGVAVRIENHIQRVAETICNYMGIRYSMQGVAHLFQFRSARAHFGQDKKHAFNSISECLYDLIAEFLTFGHIRLNQNTVARFARVQNWYPEHMARFNELPAYLEGEFTALLKRTVGQIIMD